MEHLFTNDTPAYIDRPVNPAGLNCSPPCSHLPGKKLPMVCSAVQFFQLYFSVLFTALFVQSWHLLNANILIYFDVFEDNNPKLKTSKLKMF